MSKKAEVLASIISGTSLDLRQRTLDFLNSSWDIALVVQDAPHYGNPDGYGIGPTVAQRILDKRATLNESKFTSLYQLGDIKGFSHDKLTDLLWFVQGHPTGLVRDAPLVIDEGPWGGIHGNEAQSNNDPGLWWLKKNGCFFKFDKPIIIFIHGASGVPTWQNNYWQSNRFQQWNAGVFNWSDYNLPVFAYGHKAHELYGHLAEIISCGYNNNEIRFAAYSWGMHVACYAAAKLVKYINDNNRNIFVSVDLIDPVDKSLWPAARDVETNEMVYRSGVGHVTTFLNYVATNQVVGMKLNKKLCTIVIEYWYDDWQVLLDILPQIYHHVEVFQDGIWHMDFDGGPTAKYKSCEWQSYDKTKIDLNNRVYAPGPDKIWFEWIEASKYKKYLHGPIQGQRTKYPTGIIIKPPGYIGITEYKVWVGVQSRYW